jgi:hypothetical protein
LTLKQGWLNTFDHKQINKIVFSPRIYYWYLKNNVNSKRLKKIQTAKSIPDEYFGLSQLDIYDLFKASPRYSDETIYLPLLQEKFKPEAGIKVKSYRGQKSGERKIIHETPLGKLEQTISIGGGLGGHLTEYPVKSVDDIKLMEYILNNTEVFFSNENFEKAQETFGDRGLASSYLWRSPYQKLITQFMGFTRTILLLKKYPTQIENFITFMERWDDTMYEEIARSPLKIVNFGENIDANLSPPPYFEKYLVPYYEYRVKELHKAGKFCHIHIDGSLKDLLPYFEDLPFDGLEALTAEPQGDVSLQEIKDAIGDKILLDGIPSILLLPEYSMEYVRKYTMQVLNLFSPNLILGISDEMSPNGDIKKIEWVSEIAKNFEV